MSNEYIEVVTWNRKMMLMYGDKLTGIQKAIGRRSNGLHTSIKFSPRYGRISWSCTKADGANGCRFKMIEYSHPYRQSRVRIYVTAEQEARLFAKCCEMADWNPDVKLPGIKVIYPDTGCWYGPNHIKYDTWYATFGFISKWKIWGEHKDLMICNEACANVLLEVWADLLLCTRNPETLDVSDKDTKILDPAQLTPDQFHYLVEYYFEHQGPTQQDIDNIIEEVNE